MSSPARFSCICGNTFASEANLRGHQRRHCRGGTSSNDGTCPVCNAQFQSYRGMRQHMRTQHQSEYNAALQEESRGARQPWTTDEINLLARKEAEYSGDNLYAHLAQFTSRTKDAIKSRRRLASYKTLVESIKRDLEEHPDLNREEQDYNNNIDRLTKLKDFIANISDDDLDSEAKTLKYIVLTQHEDRNMHLEEWCSSIISKYRKRPIRDSTSRREGPRDNIIRSLQREGINARTRRRLLYKLAQHDYKNDQKALADRILDGHSVTPDRAMPSLEDLSAACSEAFSAPSTVDQEPYTIVHPDVQEISAPVSAEEVSLAIKEMNSNAAGADGLTLPEAKRIPIQHLVLLFNSIMYLCHIPSGLKRGRTILIPKKKDDLYLASNWRPITIPPVLLRIFNKIIAKRLSNVELHHCQRGFSRIDGCFANYAALETILKTRRKKGLPLSLIFLDLAKAFDTVSQNSIGRALKRLNIDDLTRKIIAEQYQGCTTKVHCCSKFVGEFDVNRGVKQGDPDSPLLFNMVLDELLTEMDQKSGIPIGTTTKVCALAYADDLVLAATNTADAQRMLNLATEFFAKRGLMINVKKCSSVILNTVPGKKKVFTVTEPTFKIGNENIPIITIEETYRYLGQRFTAFGITPCTAENLNNQLNSIRKAPLKPQQKFTLLTKYLIPRYISSVQRPNINRKILKEIDKKIRSALRNILSLFQHCSNNILYAPLKQGGLGVFCFSANIPRIVLARWENIKITSPLNEDLFNMSAPWVNRLQRLIPGDSATKEDVCRKFAEGLQQSSSGGLQNVQNHRACRSFVTDPPIFWKGGDYVKALQLRYNLLPCRAMASNVAENRLCRAGCLRTESLSHILQRCPITYRTRILRHDFVVKRLQTAAIRKGWTASREPHIRGADNVLRKPDLIFKKRNVVVISDVGIHWEGETSLEQFYHHKVAYYSTDSFIHRMQELNPDCRILVLPLILGARGTWCSLNVALEKEIGLGFKQIVDIITTTLRGGWISHHHFMSSVWRVVRLNSVR